MTQNLWKFFVICLFLVKLHYSVTKFYLVVRNKDLKLIPIFDVGPDAMFANQTASNPLISLSPRPCMDYKAHFFRSLKQSSLLNICNIFITCTNVFSPSNRLIVTDFMKCFIVCRTWTYDMEVGGKMCYGWLPIRAAAYFQNILRIL